MRLVDNFWEVLTRAWSVRFGTLAGLFSILNYLQDFGLVLPFLEGWLPQRTYLCLALLCGVAGFIARFLKQNSLVPADEGVDA